MSPRGKLSLRPPGQVAPVAHLPALAAPPDPDKLFAREDFVAAIRSQWDAAERAFLWVGRYLVSAKARLPHGEFGAMLAADMPFSHPTANKLMGVAKLVDSGAMLADALPRTQEAAYLVTTLTPDERARGVEEGVIHPNARRKDIEAFRQRLHPVPAADRRAALLARRARLQQQIEEIDRELRGL